MAPPASTLSALLFITYVATTIASYPSTKSPHDYIPPQDPHTPPQYAYAYDVQDPYSGVFTSKHETRDGDVVFGSYSLDDADGSRRTVRYTSDPVHGFNAEVLRENGVVVPHVHALPAVPVPVPVTVPVVHTYVASAPPLAPAPPVHQVYLSTPLAYSLAPAAPVAWRSAPTWGYEPARYRTSLTSPTHSYSY